MNTYLIQMHNGYEPGRWQQHISQYVEADYPAEAVRLFLDTYKFERIGPVGRRVYHIYDITNKRRVEAVELSTVLKTFPAVNGSGHIVHAGEVIGDRT
jgi:hypothetical protein